MEDKKYIQLEKIGNKKPFSLPANYFDEFAAKMDNMVTDVPSKRQFRLNPWMYGVAASLIGVVLLGQVYLTETKQKKQLAQDVYDTYVLSQVNENSIIDFYLASDNNKE